MRISVVIPVKDDAEELRECLARLRAQTLQPHEIVVVDNGSTDDTVTVAREAGARVVAEPVPGIPSAAARGYDEATGDVIARLDADSRPDADWLERVRITLEQRREAIAVTGRGRFHDLGPVASGLAQLFYMRAYFVLCGGGLARRPVFGSNFAMRTDVWRRVSPEVHRHDDVHDDLDLSFHFSPAEVVVYDPDLVVAISGRPFRDPRAMLKRVRRAWTTFAVHGWRETPMFRWRRRLLGRA